MMMTFLDITVAGLIMGGIYALIGIGLNIQWGVTRVLNMAHGEFIMIGAYTVYGLQQASRAFFGDPSPGITFLIAIPVSG